MKTTWSHTQTTGADCSLVHVCALYLRYHIISIVSYHMTQEPTRFCRHFWEISPGGATCAGSHRYGTLLKKVGKPRYVYEYRHALAVLHLGNRHAALVAVAPLSLPSRTQSTQESLSGFRVLTYSGHPHPGQAGKRTAGVTSPAAWHRGVAAAPLCLESTSARLPLR